MKRRVQVTQEQAEALNAHQGKMQAASAVLLTNFNALLKTAEVEADLDRMTREEAGGVRPNYPGAKEHMFRADRFATALLDLRHFQVMLAEEISGGIGAVLRNRTKLREVLRATGLLEAAESGSMDDVEIVVGVANPPFSQPAPEGDPQ